MATSDPAALELPATRSIDMTILVDLILLDVRLASACNTVGTGGEL